jgi:hypothetical protein
MGACGKGFANCRWVTSSSIYTRVQLLPDPRCLEFLDGEPHSGELD